MLHQPALARRRRRAIEWAMEGLVRDRLTQDKAGASIDPANLPRELQRRLLLAAFDRLAAPAPEAPTSTAR